MKGMTADEVEMSEEFYYHYTTAPVIVWIAPADKELEGKLSDGFTTFK